MGGRGNIAVLLLPLLLCACATAYDPTPDIHDVTDPAAVSKDVADCSVYAAAYKRPLNLGSVMAAGGEGSANNLSSASVSGYVGPLLGGLGGLAGAVLQWVGLLDVDTPRAAQQCVRQRLDRDHAGILVEAPL